MTIEDTVESHGYITVRKYSAKDGKWITVCQDKHNLLTNEGRDHMHAQVYTNTAAGTRGFNYMALSSDSNAVSATHTAEGTAAGDWDAASMEITAAGLARVEVVASGGTTTHTGGTNQTVHDKTFTNTSGSQVANIQKVGLFNAADGTGGEKLGHEASFTATTLENNDKIQIIYTLNLG